MAKKQKFDGVIVGVHFHPGGKVDWARVFMRRGAIFSDRLILSRQQLVEKIKQGRQFIIGERIEYLAGTFDVLQTVAVINKNGEDILVSSQFNVPDEQISSMHDLLTGVPVL